MSKTALDVICRAVQSSKNEFKFNKTWDHINTEYSIGLKKNRDTVFVLQNSEKARLIDIIKNKWHIDATTYDPSQFKDLYRHEVLSMTQNEKLTDRIVRHDRIALKALPGYQVKINQQSYELENGVNLDYDVNDIHVVNHDVILVIENLESFYLTHELKIDMRFFTSRSWNPLVVYRGDISHNARNVLMLIEKTGLPVLVMSDFDPCGLVIAQSMKGAIGYIAPAIDDIEAMLLDPEKSKASRDKFFKQFTGVLSSLDKSSYPCIYELWSLMKRFELGMAQELWVELKKNLIIYEFIEPSKLH